MLIPLTTLTVRRRLLQYASKQRSAGAWRAGNMLLWHSHANLLRQQQKMLQRCVFKLQHAGTLRARHCDASKREHRGSRKKRMRRQCAYKPQRAGAL